MSLRGLAILPTAIVVFGGCAQPGLGDGWVVGSLWVENCNRGRALDRGDFDLLADSFLGDPLFDTSASAAQQRSSLFIRIQETSANIDEANFLGIQMQDTVTAAQAFVEGIPVPITDESFIPNSTDLNPAIRLNMNLLNTCPTNFATMAGVALDLGEGATGGTARGVTCLLPTEGPQPDSCPSIGDDDRRQLDDICQQADFDDRTHRQTIEQILGTDGACMYLCRFGKAARGDDPGDLQGFEIDYGDEVAALFSTRIVDTRSYRATRCAGAQGHLAGMFRFELVRSRSAQPFP